ncbi:MAG TPA: dolichyl-phosphate beta-glucosyltransferase [Vicinamibacterales bacterium]|nr:dolichyl-phosphate beta-glucosyltransferase [Vicinamibacterales bacterium]
MIVPAFNEVGRIGATVSRIQAFLGTRPYSSELIVVLDGGAPGAAQEIARVTAGRPGVVVLDNQRNRGKGFSVRRGMRASRGTYALFADADLSLPIEDADRFVAELEAGADLAIGSRAVPGATERGEQQRLRQSMSRVFNGLVRALAVPGLRDTQCGFKAFRGDLGRALFAVQRIDGFGFDVEVLRIAQRRGCRVVEVPVACEYHPTSSVRQFRHAATMLVDLSRIVWHDRRGHYDALR